MLSTPATKSPQSVLFLFAHNDDEFFVLPRVEREVNEGSRVICVYTTDGAAYGASPERRLLESLSVLCPRGVAVKDIIPLGTQLGVRDGISFKSVELLSERLGSLTEGIKFARIYAPAWDGGHADHDAAHLLAVALARMRGSEVLEFSLYHGLGAIGPILRCMAPIAQPGIPVNHPVTLRGALSWLLAARHYQSQRRVFLGLLPLCLPQILLRRSLPLRRVGNRNYRCRPHSGKLFYEARFKVPYQDFYDATLAFIERAIESQALTDAQAS